MEAELRALVQSVKADLSTINTQEEISSVFLKYFGKNGAYTIAVKGLKDIPNEDKPRMGALANQIKKEIEAAIDEKKSHLGSAALEEWMDVTMPGHRPPQGHLHLVTQAISEITNIFERIGFTRVRYHEVEWEWYAFEALNMASNSPARDDFETFFMQTDKSDKYGRVVLSPHTSSGQVREMERVMLAGGPPIRMINIAKCYRPNWDVSHVPMFHQFEGLVVDKGINITHLKGTIDYFVHQFFGPERKTRLRPFHFQFTEPSFELDITCDICGGEGCRMCKEGWLELGGCGMVHPNVLQAGKIDPNEYTGFAFGWGIERVYTMKEGVKIDDLRMIYGNDVRFLEQF